MLPKCPQCLARVYCNLHSPSPGTSGSSSSQTVHGLVPEQSSSGPSKLPKSFVFYQPSHPVTLPAPLADLNRSTIASIAAQRSSSSSAQTASCGASNDNEKRKLSDPEPSAPPASKRHRPTTDALPRTILATPPIRPALRSAANDCWYHIAACETAEAPPGVSREELLALDIDYQASKRFYEFRRPMSERLRCISCLKDHGIWKTWVNRSGGVTGRIRQHLNKHHGADFLAKCQEEGVVPRERDEGDLEDCDTEFSPELFAQRLAEWVAVDDQAMNVVERREFRRLLQLCSQAPKLRDSDIPHRSKITKTSYELYLAEKERINKELQNARGRISITSDLWSDDTLRAFMSVTAHYINCDGDLAEHLIAFRRIKGQHTGANMGQALFTVFNDAGILHKIGHITLDNASNNNTMMAELEEALETQGQTFGRDFNRIRCFPHVVNLAVQAILDALPTAARRFREQAAAKGDTLDQDALDYLDALQSGLVGACRESVKSMRSSDTRREGFREMIQNGNFEGRFKTDLGETIILPLLQLLRDSDTRWSSTYNMILRYLQLYPAVLHYSLSHPSMNIPVISHKQYEVLQDLVSVLSVLHHAQELLSAERTPTIALALPVYESLIQALNDCTFKFPELQHAITCGVQKIEAYVAKTRNIPVYALAMIINSSLKFEWIDQHWSQPQRQHARVNVKEQMLAFCQENHRLSSAVQSSKRTRAEHAAQAQNRGYMRLLTLSSGISRASDSVVGSHREIGSNDYVSELPSVPQPQPNQRELLLRQMVEVDTELLRWEALDVLDAETMGTVGMVAFWKARRYEFPLLYRIAMDVLCKGPGGTLRVPLFVSF